MAQKARKEGEKIEKPSIAVKEKKSPGERRELTDDQKKKKGEVELLMPLNVCFSSLLCLYGSTNGVRTRLEVVANYEYAHVPLAPGKGKSH